MLVPFSRTWQRLVDPADLFVLEQLRLHLFWVYYAVFLAPFVTASICVQLLVVNRRLEYAEEVTKTAERLEQNKRELLEYQRQHERDLE